MASSPKEQPGGTITINDLPDEILCNIFECVLQMSRRDVPFEESIGYLWIWAKNYPKDIPPEESMLVPLRLSQVCRLWNNLVMSCPSLWTDITVLIYKFDSTRRDKWLSSTVNTWISRSRLSPLRLRFECDTSCLTTRGYPCDEAHDNACDVPGPTWEITAHILMNLLDHQHRWKDASFTFIGSDPGMIPQLGLVDAPLLESLSICWGGFTQHHDMTQIDLDISRSPRLSNLNLKCIPRIITLRASNLRELTLDSWWPRSDRDRGKDIQQSVLLDILRDMPSLEVLDISVLNCASDAGISNPQSSLITLPKLHTFMIYSNDCSTFVVRQLILPGLKRLICKRFPDDDGVDMLSDMLVRSRASLEYFEFRWTMMVERVFAPFLRLMPSLKTLCMECVTLTSDLFEMLSANEPGESREANSVICPNLEELFIAHCIYYDRGSPAELERTHVELLRDMLQKRCDALGRVATVVLHAAGSIDQDSVRISPSTRFDILFEKPLLTESQFVRENPHYSLHT